MLFQFTRLLHYLDLKSPKIKQDPAAISNENTDHDFPWTSLPWIENMNDSNENSLVSSSPQPCVLTMSHRVVMHNPLTWYCFVSFRYSVCDHVFCTLDCTVTTLYFLRWHISNLPYVWLIAWCVIVICQFGWFDIGHAWLSLNPPLSLSSVQFLETISALSFLEQKHMDHPKCLKKRSSCLIELR